MGRIGFPGAPLEQNAGSPKSSGERQPVSVLCVSWGRRALPMVFARSLQPARALPMYVPLCRPRKAARCSGRGRTTPARSALAGWRKPTAARLDEARKGCVVECGVKLGDASAGVRGSGLARAERELGVTGSTFGWRSVVAMVADGPQLAGRDWTNGRTLEDQLVEGKLWAEDSVDPVLEGRRQLFGVALCVSWGTWPRMEGFAVVACGESFVLPGGQTSRSVDAAAQGAAHGIGYNSRATIVLLVTTTGMFCDKASWSIVSRQKGFLEHPWSKMQDHPSRRVRGSRCLCYAFPGGEGRCPWSRVHSSATSRRPDLC